MSRPQETFNKKELEKRRLQKRKEKEQRKEQRKAESKEGKTLDDMIAYVDENGNISSTPPDPTKKRIVNETDIDIGVRNTGNSVHGVGQGPRTGKVTFFNRSKGFGFIKDAESGESVFVHTKALETDIQENDNVSFEIGKGFKGSVALHVRAV